MGIMSGKTKKVYTLQVSPGCNCLRLDCDNFERLFLNNGYITTDKITKASVIIIGTCTSEKTSEDDSLRSIGKAIKCIHKDAALIITGCFANVYKDKLERQYNCLVVKTDELDLVKEKFNLSKPFDLNSCRNNMYISKKGKQWRATWKVLNIFRDVLRFIFPSAGKLLERFLNVSYEYSPKSYMVKVSEGCANCCSYCFVKKARGHIRSRKTGLITEEIKSALIKGHQHFVLVSDDFTSYGIDIGTDFIDLLRNIFLIADNFSITIRNFNPGNCMARLDDFIEMIVPGKIKCIELILQSGSNKILNLMNRNYTKEDFIAIASALLNKDPAICFRTHVIVGFPQEDEEDFAESMGIITTVPFEHILFHEYSERPGTPAASLPGKLKDTIIKKRAGIMRKKARKTFLVRLVRYTFNPKKAMVVKF